MAHSKRLYDMGGLGEIRYGWSGWSTLWVVWMEYSIGGLDGVLYGWSGWSYANVLSVWASCIIIMPLLLGKPPVK